MNWVFQFGIEINQVREKKMKYIFLLLIGVLELGQYTLGSWESGRKYNESTN